MGDFSSSTNLSVNNSKEFSAYVNIQDKLGKLPLNQVFDSVLQDLNEKVKELESLVDQYSGQLDSSNTSQSRSFSQTSNEEGYAETLDKKGIFIDMLTDAVKQAGITGIPKYVPQTYHEFLSLFHNRYCEATQEINQNTERIKNQEKECLALSSQVNISSSFTEEDQESFPKQEHHQARLQFQNAKNDLDFIINMAFSSKEEDVKKEFLAVMSKLVDAYVNNMDSKEDQFIEITSQTSVISKGMRWLIQGNVVVYHPHDPNKIRLCVD